jgi:O-antigen/teichoic acid export membrane protein
MQLVTYIRKKIFTGHEQSIELKKNIIISVGIKLLSLALGIVYMPTILTFIDKSLLGIVMTIDSLVTWLYLADIGIGNGLKNKLTEAIAKDNKIHARQLVSTAYISLFSVLIIVFIISAIIASFINWNSFLKVDIDPKQLLWSVQFVLFSFLFSFGVRLINNVIQAHQMSFLNSISQLIIKIVKLVAIFIAIRITSASLLKYVLIDHSIPLIVFIALSIILYKTKFKDFRPSFSQFKKKEIANITSLGFKFFWIQIAAMILFSTDNIIIVRLFTTGDVAVYNIIRHYYSQAFMIFTFISVPLWTAYTKAFAREDYVWIKRITWKISKITIYLSLLILVMFIFYQPVIKFWLRGKIEVPVLLSFIMALAQILQLLVSPFTNFQNGTGKIKLSLRLSPFIIFLNIPLSILFAKPLGMGISGVIFATCICQGLSLIISYIQYDKIINQKATGIWNE